MDVLQRLQRVVFPRDGAGVLLNPLPPVHTEAADILRVLNPLQEVDDLPTVGVMRIVDERQAVDRMCCKGQ